MSKMSREVIQARDKHYCQKSMSLIKKKGEIAVLTFYIQVLCFSFSAPEKPHEIACTWAALLMRSKEGNMSYYSIGTY